MQEKTIVAISMITYNHEKYIAEAIEGVLMQKTDFKIKLYITDDKSPDKTVQICKGYADKYPDIIDFESFEINKGSMNNWIYNLKKCQNSGTDYIAICEGDDYWIDPLKLQKQVDTLQKNQDCNVSLGRYNEFHQESGKMIIAEEKPGLLKKEVYSLGDYLKKKFSQTSTFLIRSKAIYFPDWLTEVHAGDQALIAISSCGSKIHFCSDSLSVYRVHRESISRKTEKVINIEKNLFFLEKVNKLSAGRYSKIISYRMFKLKVYKIVVSSIAYKLYKGRFKFD